MDYLEAVKQGKEAAKSQWVLGDLALSVEPKYGEGTLKQFADDIGVELKTLQNYRTVAAAYPEKSGRPDIYTLAERLAAQPDRAELVKTVHTVKEARDLVRSRKEVEAGMDGLSPWLAEGSKTTDTNPNEGEEATDQEAGALLTQEESPTASLLCGTDDMFTTSLGRAKVEMEMLMDFQELKEDPVKLDKVARYLKAKLARLEKIRKEYHND